MAQQVKRAAALTAELATQSEEKTAAVCDRPPGLNELAGHIEAPNMVAGGSHPHATMVLDPWARSCRPSEGQTTGKAPPETVTHVDSSGRPFTPTRGFRGARIRSTTRAPLNTRARGSAAVLEETLRLFVEATDKDKASMRQQLVNKRPAELLRSRDSGKHAWRRSEEGSVGVLQKDAEVQTQEPGGIRGIIQAEGDDWILQQQH